MSFDDMMKQLRREYLQGLPERIRAMEKMLAANDIPSLRVEFHKLKGTGKTYGIAEISDLCALVEQLCLMNAPVALPDSQQAITLLGEIVAARSAEREFNIRTDARFAEIQKHLQAAGGSI